MKQTLTDAIFQIQNLVQYLSEAVGLGKEFDNTYQWSPPSIIALLQSALRSLPYDIRQKGWSCAVHNDYQKNATSYTFWLFTKDGRAVKGEGPTDADALEQIRREISKIEASIPNSR